MSEMRKFVFVFEAPLVNDKGITCEDGARSVIKYGKDILGWQLEQSHNIPLTTTVQIGDKTK